MFAAITAISILLYATSTVLFGKLLFHGGDFLIKYKVKVLSIASVAVLLHAYLLFQNVFTPQGLNLGFFNAVSMTFWLSAVFVLSASLLKPVSSLCILILPLTAVALLLDILFPNVHLISADNGQWLNIHILISLFSYSLLGIAALQAVLLAIQDRYLHNRHPGGIIRLLPPMESMETLLFQIIGIGFVLHTLSLASGILFLDNIFSQHIAHKTLLSIAAWAVFAVLLIGRWYFGWRGRIAIRWTLGGFAALLLAYLGSKLVLEIILGR